MNVSFGGTVMPVWKSRSRLPPTGTSTVRQSAEYFASLQRSMNSRFSPGSLST